MLTRVMLRRNAPALGLIVVLTAIAVVGLAISHAKIAYVAQQAGGQWGTTVWTAYRTSTADDAMQAIPLVAAVLIGVRAMTRERAGTDGTFTWSQGVTKRRWLLATLGISATILIPCAVVLSAVFAWWYQLYLPRPGYFAAGAFELYPPAMVGWTLAGLTLGAAVGALTRGFMSGTVLTVVAWVVLHKVASAWHGDFWLLQMCQLTILVVLSASFIALAIWALEDLSPQEGLRGLLSALPRAGRVPAGRSGPSIARATLRQHRRGLIVALLVFGVISRLNVDGTLFDEVICIVIGASLGAWGTALDWEDGSLTFAFTQGLTRGRWITGRLLTLAVVLSILAALSGIVLELSYAPAPFTFSAFVMYPVDFVAWTLAGLAAAALLGVLLRSAFWSMLGTMAAAIPAGILLAVRTDFRTVTNRPSPTGSVVLWTDRWGSGQFDHVYEPQGSFWSHQALELCVILLIVPLCASAADWLIKHRDDLARGRVGYHWSRGLHRGARGAGA
jgi:hypothetical protein